MILELRPHCYTVAGEQPDTLTTDFRTHWKYSKRLYYAFRPLWWAMHWWDNLADAWCPQFSFGFATLTAYPDPDPGSTTTDGYVYRSGAEISWESLIISGGTTANTFNASLYLCDIVSGSSTSQWTFLLRAITLFDCTALGSNAVVLDARLQLFGSGKVDPLGITPDTVVVASNPTSNTTLVATDFSTLGSILFSNVISYNDWSTSAYNTYLLNPSGLQQIVAGITKLGLRNNNYDISGIEPTWTASSESYITGQSADVAGTSSDPKLTVTYFFGNAMMKPNLMRPAVFSPGLAR